MPTKPEVRMILRIVFLVQRFGLDVELDLRGLRRLAAAARSIADDLDKFNRSPEDRLVLGGTRLAVRGVDRESSTAELESRVALRARQGSPRAPTSVDVDEDQLPAVLEAVLREAERRADPQPSIGLQCALVFAFAAAMLAWVWRSPT